MGGFEAFEYEIREILFHRFVPIVLLLPFRKWPHSLTGKLNIDSMDFRLFRSHGLLDHFVPIHKFHNQCSSLRPVSKSVQK